MRIIEDVFERAGVTKITPKDLRPGDRFVLCEGEGDVQTYEGVVESVDMTDGIDVHRVDGHYLHHWSGSVWYLVERAPVEEPTGWGAVVRAGDTTFARTGEPPWDWRGSRANNLRGWDEVLNEGRVTVLFEGVPE